MKCSDCCYCWKDEDDKYERCHWNDNPYNSGYMSPCEEDEWVQVYDPEPEYEYGEWA